MGSEPTTLTRKPSVDLMAVVAVGVTVMLSVFGQAAWLDGKIERLDAKLSGKIERVDGKIERVEHRLGLKIDSLQRGQVEIRERLAGVESGLEAVESRLDGVESRLDGVENRLDGVESRLDGVESRLDGVENRLAAMENRGVASPSAVAQVEAGAWRGDAPARRDNSQRGQT